MSGLLFGFTNLLIEACGGTNLMLALTFDILSSVTYNIQIVEFSFKELAQAANGSKIGNLGMKKILTSKL